jgi:7-keto-8-aminopelargonate synthetase-like enzyme
MEYYHMEGSVDVVMVLLLRLSEVWGFVAGSQYLVRLSKSHSRHFIFTAQLTPPVVCGLIKSIIS